MTFGFNFQFNTDLQKTKRGPTQMKNIWLKKKKFCDKFSYSTFKKVIFTPPNRNRLELLKKTRTTFYWDNVNVAIFNHLKKRQITQDDQNKRRKSDSDKSLRWVNAGEHLWCFSHVWHFHWSQKKQPKREANRLFPGLRGCERKKQWSFNLSLNISYETTLQKPRYYQKGMLENPVYRLPNFTLQVKHNSRNFVYIRLYHWFLLSR